MCHDQGLDLRGRDLSQGRFGGEVGNKNSLSGHERNHLFLRDETRKNYVDVAGVALVDSEADGRTFAVLDWDKDGAQDLVLVNANNPTIQMFRNRKNEVSGPANVIGVKLVGGQKSGAPSTQWSARDPFGARIEIEFSGRKIVRFLHGGEGFAAQNSGTLCIGIGGATGIDSLRVLWPSGKVTALSAIRAGTLVRIHEDPTDVKSADGSVASPYAPPVAVPVPPASAGGARFDLSEVPLPEKTRLVVLTTFATWCESCKKELPRQKRLAQALEDQGVAWIGVPVDPADQGAKLLAFESEKRPGWTTMGSPSAAFLDRLRAALLERLNVDQLPSSLVLDREGRVLSAHFGLPYLSKLKSLLDS